MPAALDVEAISTLMAGDRVAAGAALDRSLRALHGSGRSYELCALHRLAAEYWAGDAEQTAFHRTHAYVYALEAGDAQAEAALFGALAEDGRI